MSKTVVLDVESRERLLKGVNTLANAVKVTLGPKGRNVVIGRPFGAPHITKDGVSVAQEIELDDQVENTGVMMIKSVASRTADVAGDGTTTATVLAQAIIKEGMKNLAAGANPIDLKRGIDDGVSILVHQLSLMSKAVGTDVSRIASVATISANNDEEIGSLIASTMGVVGNDGVITVEEAQGDETEVNTVEGMQIERGYMSPYFATDPEKLICELEDCYVLLCEDRISDIDSIIPVLEQVNSSGKSLVIIAEDLEPSILNALVTNKMKGGLKIVSVRAPEFGISKREILTDISSMIGGRVFSKDGVYKIEDATIELLGSADKIEINKDTTTIIGGRGDEVVFEDRKEFLRQHLKSLSGYEKDRVASRLAKLAGGIAVMRIGGVSEVEMREKKDRVDDALASTRAAVEEGVVAGGGVALVHAAKSLRDMAGNNEDQTTGINILARAVEVPLLQIAENAGKQGGAIIEKIKESDDEWWGYNAHSEKYENFLDAGVLDPTKVTRTALQNAASVASMFLMTECVIVDTEKVSLPGAPQQGMM